MRQILITVMLSVFFLLVCSPCEAQSVDESLIMLENLHVAPEYTCTYYDRDMYPYHPRIENSIISRDGLISPYNYQTFTTKYESTIEHIVALKEAHDSGMCEEPATTKIRFASDLDNLVLASERMNSQKSGKDVAEWLPPENVCWFVKKTVFIRHKYNLTIDSKEKNTVENLLTRQCSE